MLGDYSTNPGIIRANKLNRNLKKGNDIVYKKYIGSWKEIELYIQYKIIKYYQILQPLWTVDFRSAKQSRYFNASQHR